MHSAVRPVIRRLGEDGGVFCYRTETDPADAPACPELSASHPLESPPGAARPHPGCPPSLPACVSFPPSLGSLGPSCVGPLLLVPCPCFEIARPPAASCRWSPFCLSSRGRPGGLRVAHRSLECGRGCPPRSGALTPGPVREAGVRSPAGLSTSSLFSLSCGPGAPAARGSFLGVTLVPGVAHHLLSGVLFLRSRSLTFCFPHGLLSWHVCPQWIPVRHSCPHGRGAPATAPVK